jgi:hypothetical protein
LSDSEPPCPVSGGVGRSEPIPATSCIDVIVNSNQKVLEVKLLPKRVVVSNLISQAIECVLRVLSDIRRRKNCDFNAIGCARSGRGSLAFLKPLLDKVFQTTENFDDQTRL